MKPEETYTIEQFISSAPTTKISYESLSIIESMSGGENELITYNVLNDYIEELEELAVWVELDDIEHMRYIYKPKLLSYDIYGSTELYFVIMYMNNICNVKEFNLKKIKMLKMEVMEDFLSSVYNSEKEMIMNNRSTLNLYDI